MPDVGVWAIENDVLLPLIVPDGNSLNAQFEELKPTLLVVAFTPLVAPDAPTTFLALRK